MFGAKLCVHYWEVVPCSEGPLSEVPLYIIAMCDCVYYVSPRLSVYNYTYDIIKKKNTKYKCDIDFTCIDTELADIVLHSYSQPFIELKAIL